MKTILAWLAARLLELCRRLFANKQGEPMSGTLTLDASQIALASNVKSVIGELSALEGDAAKLWGDVVTAAKVKFGDGWQDVITIDDLVMLIAQAVADVGSFIPNPVSTVAAEVVTLNQIALVALPKIIAAGQFLGAFVGVASKFVSFSIVSPPNGGVVGAFVDSLNGVVRPVDNPGGAVEDGTV